MMSARLRRVGAASAIFGSALLALGPSPVLASSYEADYEVEQGLSGRVFDAASPVVEARVFAYQLVERTMQKVLTDGTGRFLFGSLPAGIYKIIAHKAGFEPAVLLLQRESAEAAQTVTLALEREATPDHTDYWAMRSQIPGDVLRELELPQLAQAGAAGSSPEAAALNDGSELRAQVSAVAGVQEVEPNSDVRVSGGNVGVVGKLGDVKVFLEGDFQQFDLPGKGSAGALLVDGSTQSVSLQLQTPNQGVFDVASESNHLLTSENGFALPVEASHYRFGWNRGIGDFGETSIHGYYLEESGLYNKGFVAPIEMPFASRTLAIEGNYSHKLDGGKIRTGVRYRERAGLYSRRFASSSADEPYVAEYLDAFGDGDWQLSDRVLLEYGMFTTLRDGSVALTPRGGVVLQLGANWQTSLGVAHRFAVEGDPLADDFLPVFVEGTLDCAQSEIACYKLEFQRGAGDGDHFAFGGSFRELDTTLRMFFSDNFLDHSEGLFLVPGDTLPEMHASFRKRLSPNVVAKVSSSFAEGGGGIYRAMNNRQYQNNVELLSTTLDTRFESTATGVFVAFHRLEQQLDPYRQPHRRAAPTTAGLERLELVLNQDLSTLLDLSTDWAIQLGMELARGASFFHSDVDPEALRRQIMTGVAVRF